MISILSLPYTTTLPIIPSWLPERIFKLQCEENNLVSVLKIKYGQVPMKGVSFCLPTLSPYMRCVCLSPHPISTYEYIILMGSVFLIKY